MTDAPTFPAPDRTLPVDSEARALAWELLAGARHAVLGVTDPESGAPMLSRIALQADAETGPVAILAGLAAHTAALAAQPLAGLLIAGPEGARGSAMAQPRLSLQVHAHPLAPDDPRVAGLAARWRARDPKAAIYLGLPDFRFWRMEMRSGLLNGGFGRATRLTAADLTAALNAENPGQTG